MRLYAIAIIPIVLLAGCNERTSNPNLQQPIISHQAPLSKPSPAIASVITVKTEANKPAPLEPLVMDGDELRKEYEADQEDADAQYRNHPITITGRITGLVVPSQEDHLHAAARGSEANAVVMLDTPTFPDGYPPGEAMFFPGIMAHSKGGTFFGVDPFGRNPFYQVSVTTLRCTVGDSYHISEMTGGHKSMWGDVNISLDDCVLQPSAPIERSAPVTQNP